MDKMEIICIGCMLECKLTIDENGDVDGNRCTNGIEYGRRQWKKRRAAQNDAEDIEKG